MFRQLLIAQFLHSYLQDVTCQSKSITENVVDKSIDKLNLSIKVDNHKVFNWLLICRHKQESHNAALCNYRSVGEWMFNISKKNIKHCTISTLNESLRGSTKDSRKQQACFILPLSIIKHSSQINVWVPYRLLSWHASFFVFLILVD